MRRWRGILLVSCLVYCLFWANHILGLGEKITTREIAANFSKVYNRPLELELLGSLDEYKNKWQANMAKEPQNRWAWVVEYVIFQLLGLFLTKTGCVSNFIMTCIYKLC